MSTDADTCRRHVLPKLYEAGWTDDPISQERMFTDGRVVPAGRGHSRKPGKRADYVLSYRPGVPIAVVAAKAAYHRTAQGTQMYAVGVCIQMFFSDSGFLYRRWACR